MTGLELADKYHSFISTVIDEKGIYPQYMMSLDQDDSVDMIALMIPPEQIITLFWCIVSGTHDKIKDPKALIFGLDRTTKPGQGTEFADVLTCALWENIPGVTIYNSIKIGVINYQDEPRIVRPWDWNNQHWEKQMKFDLAVVAAKLLKKDKFPANLN